jgi:hypothetical protein
MEKTSNSITVQGAALLEEARLGLVCIAHLLTDNASGESPTIPEAILREVESDESGTGHLVGLWKDTFKFYLSSKLKFIECPFSLSVQSDAPS